MSERASVHIGGERFPLVMQLSIVILLVVGAGAAAQDFDRAVTDVVANAEAAAKVFEAEAKKQPSVKAMMDDMVRPMFDGDPMALG